MIQIVVVLFLGFLPCQELVSDPGHQASLASHAGELTMLATGTDLSATFMARDNRIKTTLEAMDPDLLASGGAGVEKRGSRYHIDGGSRPDLMKLQGIVMSFLADTRNQEIQDNLIQRGFRVKDLDVWKYYADKGNRSAFLTIKAPICFWLGIPIPKSRANFLTLKISWRT